MTYFDISKKMLRANFSRFRLYFLCSFFALTLFFSFAVLFTNQAFMGGTAVDSLISSNIIFPSVLSAAFVLLFVPYSYSVFLSARKQEQGILYALGMGRLESLRRLVGEAVALGAAALGGAFLAGTALSFFFYAVLSQAIEIAMPDWGISYKAYALTALLYGIVLILTVALQALQLLSQRIGLLLRSPYQAERKGKGYQWLKKRFPGFAQHRLLECSLLARHKKEWAIRCCFSTLLLGSALYLAGFCAVTLPTLVLYAKHNCPYDLAYAKSFGKNQVSEGALRKTLSQHDVSIREETTLPYARDAAFNYLPVSEVNEKLGCSYQIPAGSFLEVFQVELQDGYGHSFTEIPRISISLTPASDLELDSCGSDVRILFNHNPAFADRTLILHDADFQKIASLNPYWRNEMHLLRFEDWESSADGVAAVQALLQKSNGLASMEQRLFRASSKIEDVTKARQSCQFGLFLMGFVEMLLLLAAFLLIHFRIAAEQEENRRLMRSLFLVGMAASEQLRLCLFKNRMRFLFPILAALPLSLPFLYRTGECVYHSGAKGCLAGLLAALFLAFAMAGLTIAYSKKELEKLR